MVWSQQNYAKFDSRVSDTVVQYESYGGSEDLSVMGAGIWDSISSGLSLITVLLYTCMVAIGIFYFLYLFITAIKKGFDAVLEDLKSKWQWIGSQLSRLSKWFFDFSIWKIFSNIWLNIVFRFLIVWIISIVSTIFQGDSELLQIKLIPEWMVGVDLRNDTIIQPGYHVYSPMTSTYFLSPTNTFDFEIAEATANTSEELNITIDRRVGFSFMEGQRLSFYDQYGNKNIREVSSDIVMPILLESIKSVVYTYEFKELTAQSALLKQEALQSASTALQKKWINLQYLNIIDIRLPKSYLDSQEALLSAENELQLASAALETQAKKSEKELIEAKNKKEIKIVEAEWIAEYNRIISEQTLTSEGIEMKRLEIEKLRVEKWNGVLPTQIEGGFSL